MDRKLIFVIDDDVHQLKQVQMGLERTGFEVMIAENGKDALKKIKGTKPHAIVLDLDMPEMDGATFLRIVKGDKKARAIPVIVLTGQTGYEDRKVCQELGAERFLRKPLEMPILIQELETLVGPSGGGEAWEGSGVHDLETAGTLMEAIARQPLTHAPVDGRVLVIDDDLDHLRQLRIGLRRVGYKVATARDGVEGISRIGERRPHAIVLDLEMPGMDGFRFLDTVKGHPAARDIPVIILSGRKDYEAMQQAYEGRADSFLNKPIEIDQLIATIEQLRNPF